MVTTPRMPQKCSVAGEGSVYRVMVEGDSISARYDPAGVGLGFPWYGFLGILQPFLSTIPARFVGPNGAYPCQNDAQAGGTSLDMAARVQNGMAATRPHLVTLESGINDLFGGADVATTRARNTALRALIYAQDPSCKLLVMTNTPFVGAIGGQLTQANMEQLNAHTVADVAVEAAAHPVCLVDVWKFVVAAIGGIANVVPYLYTDGIHPLDSMYAIYAMPLLFAQMRNLLAGT